MSKNLTARFYQENQKSLKIKKRARGRFQNLSKE